jgi:hypothetical protein
MAVTPLLKPVTFTGVELLVLFPFPSWPSLFSPQHLTAPELVKAQVLAQPAEMAMTPLVSP